MAYIPLFPECTTEGDSVEEAFAMAQESLELALEDPRDIDLECPDLAYADHVVIGTVEVEVPPRLEPARNASDPVATPNAGVQE